MPFPLGTLGDERVAEPCLVTEDVVTQRSLREPASAVRDACCRHSNRTRIQENKRRG